LSGSSPMIGDVVADTHPLLDFGLPKSSNRLVPRQKFSMSVYRYGGNLSLSSSKSA
jgi:hypothetical protein